MYPRSEWYNSRTVKRDAAHVCLFISIIHCMKNLRLCISKALRFYQYTIPYRHDPDSSFIVKRYHSRSAHHNSPYGTCTSTHRFASPFFQMCIVVRKWELYVQPVLHWSFWFWFWSQVQSDLVIKPIFDLNVLFLHLAYTYTYTYCSIVPNHFIWNKLRTCGICLHNTPKIILIISLNRI